jgi:ligand-binding sensor domain-containing protein
MLAREGELPQSAFRHIVVNEGTFWLVADSTNPIASLNPESGEIGSLPGDPWARALAFTPDTIWLANNDGLQRLRGGAQIQIGTADGLPSTEIRTLLGTDEELWIATDAGLARYELDSDEITTVPEFEGARVSALYRDDEGAVWAGTEQSNTDAPPLVGRYADGEWQIWPFGQAPFEEAASGVITFGEDSAGRVWVSVWSGGLWVWNDEQWSHVPPGAGAPENPVLSIAAREDELLLAGQFQGIYRRNDDGWSRFERDELPYEVSSIAVEEGGAIWLLCEDGLYRYEP